MKRGLWIAAAVTVLDQLSKLGARRLTEPVALIPGVLGLHYCRNTGIAFSMLSGIPWLLGLLSLAVIALGWLVLRRYRLTGLALTGAMLMLGGAFSNAIDRLFMGYVTDMLEVLCFRFAVFNMADAALTIGCALTAISLLFRGQEWQTAGGEGHD